MIIMICFVAGIICITTGCNKTEVIPATSDVLDEKMTEQLSESEDVKEEADINYAYDMNNYCADATELYKIIVNMYGSDNNARIYEVFADSMEEHYLLAVHMDDETDYPDFLCMFFENDILEGELLLKSEDVSLKSEEDGAKEYRVSFVSETMGFNEYGTSDGNEIIVFNISVDDNLRIISVDVTPDDSSYDNTMHYIYYHDFYLVESSDDGFDNLSLVKTQDSEDRLQEMKVIESVNGEDKEIYSYSFTYNHEGCRTDIENIDADMSRKFSYSDLTYDDKMLMGYHVKASDSDGFWYENETTLMYNELLNQRITQEYVSYGEDSRVEEDVIYDDNGLLSVKKIYILDSTPHVYSFTEYSIKEYYYRKTTDGYVIGWWYDEDGQTGLWENLYDERGHYLGMDYTDAITGEVTHYPANNNNVWGDLDLTELFMQVIDSL